MDCISSSRNIKTTNPILYGSFVVDVGPLSVSCAVWNQAIGSRSFGSCGVCWGLYGFGLLQPIEGLLDWVRIWEVWVPMVADWCNFSQGRVQNALTLDLA